MGDAGEVKMGGAELDVSGWFLAFDEDDAKQEAHKWAAAEPNLISYGVGGAKAVGRPGSREHDIRTYYTVEVWAEFSAGRRP